MNRSDMKIKDCFWFKDLKCLSPELYRFHPECEESSNCPFLPDRKITIERVALTHGQVLNYNLDPNPVKMADTRSEIYRTMYGEHCWELDAIEPSELQRLVLEAVEKHIDRDQWQVSQSLEADDKAKLEKQFEKYEEALEGVDEDD